MEDDGRADFLEHQDARRGNDLAAACGVKRAATNE